MKKAPPPEAVTRIVRWAVLLFIAYAILSGQLHLHGAVVKPGVQPGQQAAIPGSVAVREAQATDCSSQSGLDNFSVVASAFLPSTLPVIKTQDAKTGTGETGSVCGQGAVLHVEYALQGGKVIFSNFGGDVAHVTIGDGQLLRGVEVGMLGMKPGGERKILFPPVLGLAHARPDDKVLGADSLRQSAEALKSTPVVARVALISLAPAIPATSLQLRVIDHVVNGGTKAQCGDKVYVDITLWKLDGTKVFSTLTNGQLLGFTLGYSEVPFGIEQSVLDMTENSRRTVILPAAFVAPLVQPENPVRTDNPLAALPREMILAEVRLDHIGVREPHKLAPAAKEKNPAPALAPAPTPSPKEPKDDENEPDDSTH